MVVEVLRERHPNIHVTLMKTPTCADFDKYKEVPETVPLDLSEDEVTWVAYKISSTARVLGAEAIELSNWILRFGYALKEFRVVFANMAD